MKINVITSDEQFIKLDVDPNESVENVKALLEVELTSGTTDKSNNAPKGGQSSGGAGGGTAQESDFEAKVAKLVELGF